MTGPTAAPTPAARRPAWLTHNVKVLCGVSFLQDAASELLYPILPIFLTVVLGGPPAVVGAIEGAAEAVSSVTKVAAGRLADSFARRPLIGLGYGLAAFGKAWISSLVPDRQQGTAQGLYRGATGAAILLAGVWAGLAWGADGQVPLLISGAVAIVVAATLPALVRKRTAVSST